MTTCTVRSPLRMMRVSGAARSKSSVMRLLPSLASALATRSK
jgi:hypothetical protein